MTTTAPASPALMEQWMEEGGSYVFYRYPGQGVIHALRTTQPPLRSNTLNMPPEADGFALAPYHLDPEHPLWWLPADECATLQLPPRPADVVEAPRAVPCCGTWHAEPTPSYAQAFARCITSIERHSFEKLVLSRREQVAPQPGFSWTRAFVAACARFVHSYVYLLHTPHTGYWMGATPEVLLSGHDDEYTTVALAGTQVADDNSHADGVPHMTWSPKNIREQQYVSDYVCSCLQRLQLQPQAEGPYTVTAGQLAHLKSVVRFTLPHQDMRWQLLQTLHPTPAVCGLPAHEAMDYTREVEDYDRGYYSGFLGRITPHEAHLYVNLRCMQGQGHSLTLYAGGGLIASSSLQEEWIETERKLQTMKYVIEKGYAC